MLASRLPDLLPPLTRPVAVEVTKVHSVAGLPLPESGLVDRPPFRAPHHGVSPVAMIGGGTSGMRPGEISLAHGGVLFLDEMGEFPTSVLDALRQPLEDGVVRVSRARATTTFPARFVLVGAMNPCPCGEGGSPGSCRCTGAARERYARRLSAPLVDRFDMAVRMDRPGAEELLARAPTESTSSVSARVAEARRRAIARSGRTNAQLRGHELERVAELTAEASALLETRVRAGALSARGLDGIRRLARTIADLEAVGAEAGLAHRAGARGAGPPGPTGPPPEVTGSKGAGPADSAGSGPSSRRGGDRIGVGDVRQALVLRCQREYLLGDRR